MDVWKPLAAVGVLLLLLGCTAESPVAQPTKGVDLGSLDSTSTAAPRTPSPAPSGVLTERECPGDCNAGFALNGREYILSCEVIPPSALSDEVVGRGEFSGRRVDVRPIVSGKRSGAVAAGPLENYCGPRQPPAKWYLYAYPY
jgi:hypothetical protein